MAKKNKWRQEVHRLPKDHVWKAKPGYKIFVADRGAVSFNYPADWLVMPGEGSAIKLTNKQPPDDDWALQISVMRLNPQVDWTGLPLATMLEDCLKADDRRTLGRDPVQTITRPGAEIAWVETRFLEENENREAFSRALLARHNLVVPFLTLDFWPEHRDQLIPIWDEIVATLQIDRRLTASGWPTVR
ncbi:MAG TPA: hypothetical protein VHL09_13835 [Dehalococcoidia bacterium]|nr:hypothetical protein [Dehalococcoidia bacterium]